MSYKTSRLAEIRISTPIEIAVRWVGCPICLAKPGERCNQNPPTPSGMIVHKYRLNQGRQLQARAVNGHYETGRTVIITETNKQALDAYSKETSEPIERIVNMVLALAFKSQPEKLSGKQP